MATTCKIIFGYTDNWGNWNITEEYYRHYDGYSEAIIPLLKEHQADITAMNGVAEYPGHKFEKIEDYGFGNCNYHYYIDMSNKAKIRVTVLKEDMDFFNKYFVSNMEVEQELTL